IIDKKTVKLTAAQPAGLFYGIQSLLQLCNGQDRVVLPVVNISDAPQYGWRGLMLDECRHFFGKEFVMKLIDQMATMKLNHFHWHLTDDQGWRIQIEAWPRLTEVGAWRYDDGSKTWNYFTEPAREGEPSYGGFYTHEQIREVVAYAAARHITIVPEIEMPGHATAAIYAYPELSCKGKPWTPANKQAFEFSDPLCAGNEKVFEIYQDVISEVVELFPSEFIHVGGDECKKDPWKTCPKCQKRMKEEHLKSVEELQSYFISRMERFIVSKGKRLIGWDEILEGGLPAEASVMSWRGYEGGIEAAGAGHDVVMSPTSFCYLDYYQGDPEKEPKAIGGFLPLEKVYSFNPMPAELKEENHHFILGGQANVWTEYMFDAPYVEYMIFPRAFAMAEVLWTDRSLQDYNGFLERLPYRLAELKARGINYREPDAPVPAEGESTAE
ncbi:MAG: beta-N-acetylhexosaminidase, partial [Bacteroidota bacterium]